jgi:diguanylate cyclase (GGDEF)-like protein
MRAAVGSFKVKLVVYFVLLALLPMTAAFWGFTTVAGTSETRRVDARLQAGLRAALTAYQGQLDRASSAAEDLARVRSFQVDLARQDRLALARLLRDSPDVYVSGPGGFHVGRLPELGAQQRVEVVTRKGYLGSIVASVPFDTALIDALRARSGLSPADSLVILHGSRIVAASPSIGGSLRLDPGRTETVSVGGVAYRGLVAPPLGEVEGTSLAVLSPQALIDAADNSYRNKIVLGLLGCLLLGALFAYVEGRAIVLTLRGLAEAADGIARGRLSERVPVHGRDEFAALGGAFNEMANQLQARLAELEAERGRLRDAIARFGEALSATHDVGQLLRVIVEAAIEATGAAGARLRSSGGAVVETGDLSVEGDRLELPLRSAQTEFGRLVLVGTAFDEEQRLAAGSLASHAAIALENARLHRIVERQALVDGLTGVANRRHCEEALVAEVARADRFGTPLSLVLADLDDFKAVNDLHGHPVGDEVLIGLAEVLRATVRESDLAGRWGGEEFLLLLPGTDAEGAVHLADRIRVALAEQALAGPDGVPFDVTCSFGVAQHAPGEDERSLLAAADRALYRAKRAGKDRVELESPIRSF